MKKNRIINAIKEKWIWVLYTIPFMSFCTRNSTVDNDLWFLLNNGKYVFNHGIPHTDPFTIHKGLHYVMQQWLSSLSFYSVYKFFGKYGLLTLNIIFFIVIAYLLYKISYLITKNRNLTVLINAFVLFLAVPYIVLRPQSYTYIILLLETYLLELYATKDNYKYLIPLPFLSLLLINLHCTMWYLQFIFLLPFLANAINIKNITIKRVKIKPLLLIALIMFLAGFINPYGHEAITFIFKSYGTTRINEVVGEMKSPTIYTNYVWAIDILLLFLTIFILIINKKSTLDIRFFCFLFGLFLLSALHSKTCIYFLFWYSYIFSYLVKDTKIKIKIKNDHIIKFLEELKVETTVILSVTFIVIIYIMYSSFIFKNFVLDSTVKYLEQNYNKKEVILFTDYDNGGYTEYKGFKSYIDPRAELFFKKANGKKDIFIELFDMQAYVNNTDFKAFLDEYQFTHLLVPKTFGLYYYLENNPNYTVEDEIYEYSDDEKPYIKLFVRNDVSILYKQTKNSEK